jgi:hypothetical protein
MKSFSCSETPDSEVRSRRERRRRRMKEEEEEEEGHHEYLSSHSSEDLRCESQITNLIQPF